MRLAHAADIHLGHRQYGLKQRETDARLSFQHFLSQAREHDTDAILIPGDLFDSRDIRPQTLQQTEELLEDVERPIIVSPGNHDENMSRRRNLTWLEYLNNKTDYAPIGRAVRRPSNVRTNRYHRPTTRWWRLCRSLN